MTEIIPSCGNNPEIIRKIRTNGSAHPRQGADCNNRFVTYLPTQDKTVKMKLTMSPFTLSQPLTFSLVTQTDVDAIKERSLISHGEVFSPISYSRLPVRKVFPLAHSLVPPSPLPLSPLIPAPFLPACSQDTSVAKLKLYKLRHKLLLFCLNRDKFSQPWEIKTRAGSTSLDLQPHKTSQMSYIGGKNVETPAPCCPELL